MAVASQYWAPCLNLRIAHNKKTVAVLLEEQSGPSPGHATRSLADSGWQVLPHAEALRLAMLKTG